MFRPKPILSYWALACSVLLTACGSSSDDNSRLESQQGSTGYRVGPDAFSDPSNFYPYLTTATGECLVPTVLRNSCHNASTNRVSQLKTGPGFVGFVFGLPGEEIPGITVDPDQQHGVSVYSGATSTYTAKHFPLAVESGQYTYFVFSGPVELDDVSAVASTDGGGSKVTTEPFARASDAKSNVLGIYLARFNHQSNRVSAPVLMHAKHTDDPHDNAVVNVDDQGNLYVLISGRSLLRSGLMYWIENPNNNPVFSHEYLNVRNITPDNPDYSSLEISGIDVPEHAGITYPKLLRVRDGFRLIYTIYCLGGGDLTCRGTRQLWSARLSYDESVASRAVMSEIRPLAAVGGHYAMATSLPEKNVVVVAFNALSNADAAQRTNLYVMISEDGGQTWAAMDSGGLNNVDDILPLRDERGLDRVTALRLHRLEDAIRRRVYLKDIVLRESPEGEILPQLLYVVGEGAVSHRPNRGDNHYLGLTHWENGRWRSRQVSRDIDHNFSTGMFYEQDGALKALFPATQETINNGLAGGAPATLTLDGPSVAPQYLARLKVPGRTDYLRGLCEMNYIRRVDGQSQAGFMALASAANPFQFEADATRPDLPAAPLYVFDAEANMYQLPSTLDAPDQNREFSMTSVPHGNQLDCGAKRE